jgi:FkbH-like protein
VSRALLSDLAWLPPAPEDFRQQLKALTPQSQAPAQTLRFLASHRLDNNQLSSLAKAASRLAASGADLGKFKRVKLGLISNSTTSLIAPALFATAIRHGIILDLIECDYGQAIQEALDPGSHLNRARPDLVLLAIDWRGLPLRPAIGDAAASTRAVTEAVAYLDDIAGAIEKNSGATILVQSVARPAEHVFGSFDLRVAGTMRGLIDTFNRALTESLPGTARVLFDVAALAENVGLADWHDHAMWHTAKLPFSQAFVPLYADHVGRLVNAIRGGSRKCLVLDLDNTIWGGVIGDDGLAGIVLGQGSPSGEAYLELQATALALRQRGIVLAVSSKNEEETARLPFREHPDMLLREKDIAVFQANWTDKAANLKAIAETLSIGLDALVLIDDNPAEREQVRQVLPEVAIPELPADPALYSRTLLASGYFECIAFSEEDRQRADDYQNNAARKALLTDASNLDGFLTSLKMVISFTPFDTTGRERIAQLINKSNQFNLTTRRYTTLEIARMEQDPEVFTLQIRLADRFGDNGMICVIICRRAGDAWEIDTWLMSCRVLGRRVEIATLQEIARHARSAGISSLRGRHVPTDRNAMVKDHYAKLGFSKIAEGELGESTWQIDLDNLAEVEVPFEVRRSGFRTTLAGTHIAADAAQPAPLIRSRD